MSGDGPDYAAWRERLPALVEELAGRWELRLGAPFDLGGDCAWVAPATDRTGEPLVLKVGVRHWEAEHEAEGLRRWDGDGAVRCFAAERVGAATALLLERCSPGTRLRRSAPETGQDLVIADLLRRLWAHRPGEGQSFRSLGYMCDRWASSFEARIDQARDRGLAAAAVGALRELPRTAEREVLLCTDLHAGNVLASQREPWLAIDPKPFVGDPAYDVVQHLLNCPTRLAQDPVGLSRRMAELLDLDPVRVRLWLFARCAQEALDDAAMNEPARRLAL